MSLIKEIKESDKTEIKDADILRDILRDFDYGLLAQRGTTIQDEINFLFTEKGKRYRRDAENSYYLVLEDRNTSTDEILSAWHGLGYTSEKAYEYALHLGFTETLDEITEMFKELTTLVG